MTLENLGDISAGHEGSVVEVDKDGDIKVHCWGVPSNVGNAGLGMVYSTHKNGDFRDFLLGSSHVLAIFMGKMKIDQ